MKKYLLPLLILLFAGTAFSQEIKWYTGSLEEAKIVAEKEKKLILIDFFSKGG